ncbi:MAG: hypothetical protein NTV97_20355 [Alphaproteobacteria bacterium]|nr:hypothetical protein [Alphaproteobacteria bacterium]
MKMFIRGEKIADDILVDVHGMFVEGDPFEVRAGKVRFAAQTKNLGYPALGTGQIVGERLVVNLMIDGLPYSAMHMSGGAAHSPWMLSPDHTAGLVQKAAA